MPTRVEFTVPFLKKLRRLARKHPAVTRAIDALGNQLEADVRPGDQIPDVGVEVYKVRLPNLSAQKGKSGGFRVIDYVALVDPVVLLHLRQSRSN